MSAHRSANDVALLEAWRGGDARAGERLVARYYPSLERYFRAKVDAREVEDLVQDAVIRLWRALPRFRQDSSFRRYAYRIAHRTLCDHLRQRSTGRGRAYAARVRLDEIDGLSEWRRELAPERIDLEAAVRTLPSRDQALLELVLVRGLSYAEVADELGTSVSAATLRARVHGIKRRLRAQLGGATDPTEQLQVRMASRASA